MYNICFISEAIQHFNNSESMYLFKRLLRKTFNTYARDHQPRLKASRVHICKR